jgi:hypothetical protein
MGLLKSSRRLRSYQRGSWAIGSKHQKHQMMNPVKFLYRIPGKRGPGPYTMKYWWTLGCFPSGIETPFRLHEFLSTYQQQHVPAEVEDWLRYFIKDPVEDMLPALEQVQSLIAALPLPDKTIVGFAAPEPSVAMLSEPMARLERSLMVHIPLAAVRAVASNKELKSVLLDEMYDYAELIRESGSTPHRRAARNELTPSFPGEGDASGAPALADAEGKSQRSSETLMPSEELATQLGRALHVNKDETAPDERRLIRLLTTFAQGSISKGKAGDAASLLTQALMFAHDDDVRGTLHSNIASAMNLQAQFSEAAFHGQEAALLQKPKGFANWATAVAYMDDFERAQEILYDGLALHPGDPSIVAAQQAVKAVAARGPAVPRAMRGRTMRLPVQQAEQLVVGSGRSFMNEFDFIVFNKKHYAAKMNPTTNEMGSVFRRVGDLGGHVSTSMSEEKL